MIFEHISSPTTAAIERQFPALKTAFEWIRSLPATPADGIIELPETEMFANIHGYNTLDTTKCRWESHRRTVDLQYCISGGEQIDWISAGALQPMNDYNETKESEHWHPSDVTPTKLRMGPGSFVIFFQGELHRPKVADGVNPAVRKLVVKIPAKLLEPLK